MKILLFIGFGSFIGGISRYLIQQLVQNNVSSSFPYGTLLVNITGCFLIGLIFAFSIKGGISDDWRLFLVTGLCGGYTTFSAFSMETITLFRNDQPASAFAYIAASVVLGLLATFIGISFSKLI